MLSWDTIENYVWLAHFKSSYLELEDGLMVHHHLDDFRNQCAILEKLAYDAGEPSHRPTSKELKCLTMTVKDPRS